MPRKKTQPLSTKNTPLSDSSDELGSNHNPGSQDSNSDSIEQQYQPPNQNSPRQSGSLSFFQTFIERTYEENVKKGTLTGLKAQRTVKDGLTQTETVEFQFSNNTTSLFSPLPSHSKNHFEKNGNNPEKGNLIQHSQGKK